MTPSQFAVIIRGSGDPWNDETLPIVDLDDPKAGSINIGRVHISAWTSKRLAALVVNVSGGQPPIFVTLATLKTSGLIIP